MMALVRSDIENSFEELGVVYDKSVLDKCVELYLDHGMEDADELVDSWMAFSVSHLQGENPTAIHLARFERELLAKKTKKNKISADVSLNADLNTSEISCSYNDTPQRKTRTPDASRYGRGRLAGSPKGCFSPASFSPNISTPSSKYAGRKNAGSILCEKKCESIDSFWDSSISIKQVFPDNCDVLKYMSFHLTDYSDVVARHINAIVSQITSRFGLEDVMPVRTKHPTNILIAGRIVCDADGKLNAESLLLESSPEMGGDVIRLDLSNLPSYSVFPGQVVVVEGLNITGQKMVASRLWCDASSPTPPPLIELPGALKIIVACGPFTTTDCLSYQPLVDLLEIVVKEDPHLLLLTGPLVDSDHPAISGGLINETFSDMFERLIDQIMSPMTGSRTEVVLVSSYREMKCATVFPTPELKIAYPKLTFAPDPCIIDVEGFLIGATSIDVLMHLGKEEVSMPAHSGDRLSRLASHILQQQHFYPLKPSMLGLPVDPTFEDKLLLQTVPHILVLPSDLRCFFKEIQQCNVVNPERLAKGLIGGSYAKLIISTTGIIQGEVIKI